MVQFNWKGTWLPNLPYNENVVVEYNNVNYISNQFVPPRDITPYYDLTYWDEMLVIFNTPTPTPSVTPESTPTPTPESTPASTPESTLTPTPTPTASPMAITGYGYNLVVLPYEPPSSGNTIFPLFSINFPPGEGTGTTNPNTFDINGVYWNEIDNLGSDRFGYYSGMTGTSVMAYFTQNGNTSIYSGSSTSFTYDGAPGFIAFNYNPNARPGELTLIQSASTNFVTGQTVFITYTTI
jgi:hypothetical protein